MRRFFHGPDAVAYLTIRSNNLENVSPMVASCCSSDLPLNPLCLFGYGKLQRQIKNDGVWWAGVVLASAGRGLPINRQGRVLLEKKRGREITYSSYGFFKYFT